MKATLHIVDKQVANIFIGNSFIEENILGILPQSKKVVPCISKPVSILPQKTMEANVNVVVVAASQAAPIMLNATRSQVELRVAKQTVLRPKDIGIVKVVSKETGLLHFEPTQTVVRQGYLMP